MFDFLKRLGGSPATYQGQEITYGPSLIHDEVLGMAPAEVWRTQPHLRTVVTFMARNIAQLGLQTFQRVDETDRQRVRDGACAQILARPNANTTSYELVYGLVADLALYDVAYLHLAADSNAPTGRSLYRLPPTWVTPQGGDAFGFASYRVQANGGANFVDLAASSVIDFHGWNPTDERFGSSPVGALKAILAEQMMAMAHRQQVWQRGGRISSVLTRPADKPWSDAARESFRRDWNSKFTGDGSRTGGTPILEDGMTISKLDFNAHEQQFVEAARLALATVAGVYHINPTMVGDNTGANYSNVREFRKMLYGDTLGPVLAQIEDRWNTFIVPILDPRPGVYVEFNIAEKLQGSFEEQSAAFASSVGAPYMLRSEARSRSNLPAIPDADTLVVPLNVLVGGQASPRDSAPKAIGRATGEPLRIKGRAPQTYEAKATEVLTKFFRRQRAVVLTALGAKAADDWWDEERWDAELSDDLFALAVSTAKQVSAATLNALGFDPDVYDEDRTLAFLRSVSDSRAGMVNATTRDQIKAALAADPADYADGEAPTPGHVFDVAESSRVPSAAVALVTTFSAFATTEAASQAAGDRASKTWITGPNPRPEHAAMSGETVPLSENFSNGQAWPGDSAGGSADDAGCNCELEISVT